MARPRTAPVRLESNGLYWAAAWRDAKGRIVRKSIGSKKRHSRIVAMRRCHELAAQHHAEPVTRERPTDGPTLSEAIKAYVDARSSEWAPATLDKNRITHRKLIAHFGEDRRVGHITHADADDWRTQLVKGKAKGHTVAFHVRNAKALFAHIKNRREVRENPFTGLASSDPIVDEREWKLPTDADVRALVDGAEGEMRILLALCAYAGLRRSEALRLKDEHVSLEKRRLRVWSKAKTGNDRWREVLIEDELAAILRERRRVGGLVVSLPFQKRHISRLVMQAAPHMGDEPTRLLRKWRDTTWKLTYPEAIVDKWLGHSLQVSRKYYVRVPETFYDAPVRKRG